jgi:hypothetical protein
LIGLSTVRQQLALLLVVLDVEWIELLEDDDVEQKDDLGEGLKEDKGSVDAVE